MSEPTITPYHGQNVGIPSDKPNNSRGNSPISLLGAKRGFHSDSLFGSPLRFSTSGFEKITDLYFDVS